MYVPCTVMFLIDMFVAIAYTALGSIPSENVQRFYRSWKRVLQRKEERKLLKCVPVIGYRVGPYGLSTPLLGLLICEDVINNVLSLMLLQQFYVFCEITDDKCRLQFYLKVHRHLVH